MANVIQSFRRSDPMRVYAMRLARKCVLERNCGEDHPVLGMERNLLEMAESKLREYILSCVEFKDLNLYRENMIITLLEAASDRLGSFGLNRKDKQEVMDKLQSWDFSSILPTIH